MVVSYKGILNYCSRTYHAINLLLGVLVMLSCNVVTVRTRKDGVQPCIAEGPRDKGKVAEEPSSAL